MDWVRGSRPWAQFDRYCRDVATRHRSKLRAAQLRDPRYLPELEQELERQRREREVVESRPSLEDWTPTVEAIYAVANDIRLLIQVMTESEIGFHLGPEGPADIIAARKKAVSLAKVAEMLGG